MATFEDNLKNFHWMGHDFTKELLQIDINPFQLCETNIGEANIKVEINGQPCFFHAQTGALVEAKNWFYHQLNPHINAWFIYGLGLGYDYDALKEWLREDSKRFLVFLEDDLRVIRIFLESERANAVLKDSQVLIKFFYLPVINWTSFKSQFDGIIASFLEYKPNLKAINLYAQFKKPIFDTISKMIKLDYSELEMSYKAILSLCYTEEFTNMYKNLPYLYQNYQLDKLNRLFPNIPLIMCGAGPSLAKHFAHLKTLENKALIVGAGSALNALSTHFITAHFSGGIDPSITQKSRLMTNYAWEIPIVYMLRYNSDAYQSVRGFKLFSKGVVGFPISEWFEKELGIKNEEIREISFGISTPTFLTTTLSKLGTKVIVLCGMDLAYTNKTRYAPGVTAHPGDTPNEKNYIQYKFPGLITEKSIKGEEVETTLQMKYEASFYSEFATRHPEIQLFNTTDGGLNLYKIPNHSLDTLIEPFFKRSYDLEGRIHAAIQNCKIPFDFKELSKVIEKWQNSFQNCQTTINDILAYYSDLESRVKLDQDFEEVVSGKTDELKNKFINEPTYSAYLQTTLDALEHIFFLDQYQLAFYPDHFTPKDRAIKLISFEQTRYQHLLYCCTWHLQAIKSGLDEYREKKYLSLSNTLINKTEIAPASNDEIYIFEQNNLRILDKEVGIDISEGCNCTLVENQSLQGHSATEQVNEVEGSWEGQYQVNYPSGVLFGDSFYQNGQLHGPSRFYDEKGKKLSETWYVKDQKQGKSYFYYASGALYVIFRFKDGLKIGQQEYFYEDGKRKTLLNYSKGVLHGTVQLFHSNGMMEREINFNDGRLQGWEKGWSETGQLLYTAEYDNGLPINNTKVWHPNGQLNREYTYRDGPDNFDYYEWDLAGKLIEKKLYFKENAIEELTKKSLDITNTIQGIKTQLEMLGKKNLNDK